ncbi:EndoU domain-containing protein [Pseudomonas sp. CMR5c]|uniref:EndoU domain-containing protein n=1 Tax=Pseudomonas sp. CMR5c TaxID=658630 RepID=UPI0009F92736|nr:EndoU domain-containing protein [Pseudomonas sp. CMR5c]AZC17600.1 hypothetical protein C4K40_2211 [Pseudomonas sp. CMR5c]
MKSIKKTSITLIVIAITSSCSNTPPRSTSALTYTCPYSGAYPATPKKSYIINMDHIFCGKINSKGEAVGFHSAPEGKLPSTISIIVPPAKTSSTENNTTTIGAFANSKDLSHISSNTIFELYHFNIKTDGKTREKQISTMFPLDCSADQVIASIANAAEQVATPDLTRNQIGDSAPSLDNPKYCYHNGAKFTIEFGFTSKRVGSDTIYTINTAYPKMP